MKIDDLKAAHEAVKRRLTKKDRELVALRKQKRIAKWQQRRWGRWRQEQRGEQPLADHECNVYKIQAWLHRGLGRITHDPHGRLAFAFGSRLLYCIDATPEAWQDLLALEASLRTNGKTWDSRFGGTTKCGGVSRDLVEPDHAHGVGSIRRPDMGKPKTVARPKRNG